MEAQASTGQPSAPQMPSQPPRAEAGQGAKPEALKCPECGSTRVVRFGRHMTRRGRRQRYQCQDCGRSFLEGSG
jgi:predicted RNA-binding Zn-ribbon protein involved in translation (DUF1610 family)